MSTCRAACLTVCAACCFAVLDGAAASGQTKDLSRALFVTDQPDAGATSETDASEVELAQFRRSLRGAQSNRTGNATLAAQRNTAGNLSQAFSAPQLQSSYVIGDFFGNAGATITVGEFTGEAVHQTIGSGSAFANNNFMVITVDAGTMKTVFLGGPGGLLDESFFEPPVAPVMGVLPDVVEDLTLNNDPSGQHYTLVNSGETVDVFDNPADSMPTLDDVDVYNSFAATTLVVPGPNLGDVVGRVRVQDNNHTLPRDRIIFDYNYFHNVPIAIGDADVNRFTPGIEKTFLGGMGSLEFRLPMAITVNSTTDLGLPQDFSNYEFGNATMIGKILLTSNSERAIGVGLGVALPTADDLIVRSATSVELIEITNDSVHLIPYLAYLCTPSGSSCFMQSFIAFDMDLSGNNVRANFDGNGLVPIGNWNDQNLLSFSTAFGSHVFEDYSRGSKIQRVSVTAEMHSTYSVNDADRFSSGAFVLGNTENDLSLVNGVLGAHVTCPGSTITLGYGFPLTVDDKVFDGELRCFVNKFF